eukprot:3130807-Pyramimonas_sp.AAC.1
MLGPGKTVVCRPSAVACLAGAVRVPLSRAVQFSCRALRRLLEMSLLMRRYIPWAKSCFLFGPGTTDSCLEQT